MIDQKVELKEENSISNPPPAIKVTNCTKEEEEQQQKEQVEEKNQKEEEEEKDKDTNGIDNSSVVSSSPSLSKDDLSSSSIRSTSSSSSSNIESTSTSSSLLSSATTTVEGDVSPKITDTTSSSSTSTSSTTTSTVQPKQKEIIDYAKYFRDIEISIRGDVSPKKSIQILTQLITNNSVAVLNNLIANGGVTPIGANNSNSELNQFLVWIPRYITNVLSIKTFSVPSDLAISIIDFIKCSVELAIDTVNFDIPDIWTSVSRIYNCNHPFYTHSKFDVLKDIKEHQNLKKLQEPQSSFYYSNLLLLVERNFYDLVLGITSSKPSLGKLRAIIKTIFNTREYLTPLFLNEYIPKLKDSIFSYFLELFFEDLQAGDKDAFKEICHSLQIMMAMIMSQNDITTIFQEFDLNRALKCFQSPNLEKKLRGLRFIKKSAKWVNKDQGKGFGLSSFLKKQKTKTSNKDDAMNSSTGMTRDNNNNTGGGGNNNNSHPPTPIDQQLLLNWIVKNEIVENFCRISDQPDIMTNGIPVMIFLCHSGKLENQHLEILWNSSIGKHESVKNTIYMAILELMIHVNLKQLDYFYEFVNKTIASFKVSDFDNELLNFIFNFSKIAIQHADNNTATKKWYGLDIFWKLLKDNETQIVDQYSQTLCIKSKSYLISLLKLNECTSLRMQYIELSIENIKNNQSVVQSLSLIVNIVELSVKRLRAMIETLEQKYKIFDIFFKEIAAYKKMVSAKVKNSLHVTPVNQTVFSGLFPHLQQIQSRFDFLEYLLSQSSIMLNTQQVDIMWDAFVTHRITDEEGEIFFSWLKSTRIVGRDRVAFPELVVKYLFTEKMSTLDWSSMTPTSYAVFERYFIYTNERNNKLKKIQSSLFNADLFSSNSSQPPPPNTPLANTTLNNPVPKPQNSPSPCPSPMLSPNNQSTPTSPQLTGFSINGAQQPPPPLPPLQPPQFQSLPQQQALQQPQQQSLSNDFSPNDYYLISLDLIGVHHLWSIALTSLSSDVSLNAIMTLNIIYQSGESSKSLKFKEEYLKICMDNISKSSSMVKGGVDKRLSINSQAMINRICRALYMVKLFITEKSNNNNSNNNNNNGGIKQQQQQQQQSQFNSTPPQTPNQPFLLKLDRGDGYMISDIAGTDTLRMLKRKVANIYGIPKPPVRSLKVYFGDKEMKDDDKCIDEYKIFDSMGVQIYPLLVKRAQQPGGTNTSSSPNQQTNSKSSNDKKPTKKQQQKDSNSSNQSTNGVADEEDDEDEVDVLDDTPIVSMVLESLQHQLGGFGLVGDVLLRKVQEPKSRIANGKSKSDQSPASILISKSLYFEQIFNLLDYDNEIAENAWNVCCDLPINTKILSDIKSIKEDIASLIPTNSLYKTIYYLKVLDSVLDPTPSSSSPSSLQSFTNDKLDQQQQQSSSLQPLSQEEFKTRFIQKRGVNYLVQIIVDTQITSQKGNLKLFYLLLKNLFNISLLNNNNNGYVFRGETSYILGAPHFIQKLHLLVSSVSEYQSLNESVDFNMMCHYGMEILSVSMKSAPKNLEMNMENTKGEWSVWLKSLLLECLDPQVQHKASNLVLNLTTGDSQNNNGKRQDAIDRSLFFLSRLLSFLPTINQYYHTAEQYFCLLSELLNIGYPTTSPSPSPKPNHHHKTSSVDNSSVGNISSNSSTESLLSLSMEDLKIHAHGDKNESLHFVKSLLSKLVIELINMPIREISSTQRKDHILVGILNVIRNLVRRRPSLKSLCKEKNLVQILFKNCLFKTPTANDHVQGNGVAMPPLCKTKDSRLACFRLLRELAKNDPNNFFLVERLINEEIDRVDPNGDWNYSPSDKEKGAFNYVGLKNQGATCYMNSLIQQLYHSTGLRNSILSLAVAKPVIEQPIDPNAPPKDKLDSKEIQQIQEYNMLNQIQLLFIYLQESSKRYYDPIGFCKSIVNYDGTFINLGIQMDAYEFFHLFLDKMEMSLQHITPASKNILKESLGGVLTNQFIPKNCQHKSHCEEPFYSISLEVKNKKSLLESLELFIQEESLKDYKCEACSDRVEITKRCLIDKLPSSLILHLKRFEYDLENMRNIKLNDFCEFPLQLNMAPYTKEIVEMREGGSPEYNHMDQSDYIYDLTGIVLHAGTADSGHYITLVKDAYGNWFELNDTFVQPYDFRRLQMDCFGGFDEVKEFDKVQQKYVQVRRAKSCNAYMLFYSKSNAIHTHHRTSSIPSAISKEALDSVWNENRAFLLEKYLYDLDFSSFVWDIVNLYHQPSFDQITPTLSKFNSNLEYDAILSSIKLTTKYLIDIYSHSKERGLLDVWAYHLKRLMKDSLPGTDWFITYLADNKPVLRSILMGCFFEKTRQVFVDIISFAVLLRKNAEENKEVKRLPSIVSLFTTLLGLVKSFKDYPRRTIQQLFTLLLNVTVSSLDHERDLLVQGGVITKIIETYIGSSLPTMSSFSSTSNNSNHSNSSTNTTSIFSSNNNSSGIGNSSIVMENNKVIDFLSYAVRCGQPHPAMVITTSQLNCYPGEKDRSKPRVHIITDNTIQVTPSPFKITTASNNIYTYSEPTLISLLSKSFLMKFIKEYGWNDSAKQMVKHLCWNNKTISSHMFTVTKEILLKSPVNTYQFIVPMLTCLLEIQDQMVDWRIDAIMASLLKLPEAMNYNHEGQDAYVRYFATITGFASVSNYYTSCKPIQIDEFLQWKIKHKEAIAKFLKDSYYR